jgi:hypothetical protein
LVLAVPSNSKPAEPPLSASEAEVPPGEYPDREALRLGLVHAGDFARSPGEPICPPLGARPSPAPRTAAERVRPGGTCWRSPAEQGIVVIVPSILDRGFG